MENTFGTTLFAVLMVLLSIATLLIPYFLSKHVIVFTKRKYVRWLAVLIGAEILFIHLLALVFESSGSTIITLLIYFGMLLSMYGIPLIVLLLVYEMILYVSTKFKRKEI